MTKFKAGEKVMATSATGENTYESRIVRYMDEMTKYGTDEHLEGWYELEDGCYHESNIKKI